MRKFTRDRAIITQWAADRGALPGRVRGASGVLRLVYGPVAPNWELISWEEFFSDFEVAGLVFMYESTPGSRICKLIRANLAEADCESS
jgi:hypothetical protein